jgi:two-component system, cell cycle sensor histidine kinase and response regulator CckA
MIESTQKQPQIKVLPAFGGHGRLRLRETDLSDVVRTVESLLPRYVNGDMDVTITLLEKNLKIMADMALMRETLAHLIENAMDTMPGYGKFSLTVSQANFEIESLLKADDTLVGACAFVSFAGGGAYSGVDEKTRAKMVEPFFTTKTDDNGPGLAIAYRVITEGNGRIKGRSGMRQNTEVNIYLPLTRLEIVSMMSIPLGASSDKIH